MYRSYRIHILVTPLMQLILGLINQLVDRFIIVLECFSHVFFISFLGIFFFISFLGTAAFFLAGRSRFLDFYDAGLTQLLWLPV